jgi:hypothetical protein
MKINDWLKRLQTTAIADQRIFQEPRIFRFTIRIWAPSQADVKASLEWIMQTSAEKKMGISKSGSVRLMVLSFALTHVIPAMAHDAKRIQGTTHGASAYARASSYDRNVSVEDALRWGYGQGYSTTLGLEVSTETVAILAMSSPITAYNRY